MDTAVPSEKTVSEDALLDGRVRLRQPTDGYRAAVDPVLLAAAVPARGGQRVLDAGAGVGAAALCLAARVPDAAITALEADPELAALARENAALNKFAMTVLTGDIVAPPGEIEAGSFDHVMMNPPYLARTHGNPSPNAAKRAATRENDTALADWTGFACDMLKRKGALTLVHRADRLDAVLAALHGRFGDIAVFPLWPRRGAPEARRVIVRARKEIASPLRLLPGLVLHESGDDNGYTEAASRVLRGGEALTF